MAQIRTRFAPSPTGFLHLGSARTALYCWLFARKMQGTFILRIEDTDAERSTKESVDAILSAMSWLQLDYDEGPYYQSQRMDRYVEAANQLLQAGKAYRCYCSKERLESLRTHQIEQKQKPRYDGHCRAMSEIKGEPYVIRFRNPDSGEVKFQDLVRGNLSFQNDELDDLIIVRTDGWPTYNFTVVIDDADMQITHVIRGDDHINNTPRQINIMHALGFTPPVYGHLSTILGSDGTRLSKRHGAVSVMQYKEDGYLPEAMLNYLARLGWSHGDQEIFSRAELIEYFDFDHINHSSAAFNPEKLLWLNQHYIKTLDNSYLQEQLKPFLKKLNLDLQDGPELSAVIDVLKDRSKTLTEMAEKSVYFYQSQIHYNPDAAQQFLVSDNLSTLKFLKAGLNNLAQWNKESLHQFIQEACKTLNIKMPKIAQPLRVALTGDTNSPSIDVTLQLIGKEKSLVRIHNAITYCEGENNVAE